MVVLVCGSRSVSFVRPDEVASWVRSSFGRPCSLVSGGARGVDSLAPAAARLLGCASVVVRPDYAAFGRRAPLVRDRVMVEQADAVLAVWDGVSRGTAYTVACARRAGLPVVVVRADLLV